jgi:TonB family protein
MAAPRRPRKRRASGIRPGAIASALLHLGVAALLVLASWQRDKPPEPLPPPSFEVQFEAGSPERPAQEEAAASEPTPPPTPAPQPPAAETAARAEPEPPLLPPPPPPPPVAPQATQAEPPPPPPPPEAQTAEAELPPPPLPAPPPPMPPPPTPPAPAPAPPQRDAALTAPPRPVRPPAPERLPGLFVPDARLNPSPPRPEQRRGLDLSPPSAMRQPGRDSPDAQLSVRGAQVGPDWRNAFRRWMDEHGRYPTNAAVVGDQGTTRIVLTVDPDGRVRSGQLVRKSGSVWLDAGTVSLFRNALLPAFPPDADPTGVTVDLTINYILVR